MSDREIQKSIREAKKTLANALKGFVYDKKIDKSEFIKKLDGVKNQIDQLMIKVSEETEETDETDEVEEEVIEE